MCSSARPSPAGCSVGLIGSSCQDSKHVACQQPNCPETSAAQRLPDQFDSDSRHWLSDCDAAVGSTQTGRSTAYHNGSVTKDSRMPNATTSVISGRNVSIRFT